MNHPARRPCVLAALAFAAATLTAQSGAAGPHSGRQVVRSQRPAAGRPAWARVWRGAVRPEFLRQWLLTILYAPQQYRANGAVGNIQAFYEAFGVKPGDRLYRDPAARVTIW